MMYRMQARMQAAALDQPMNPLAALGQSGGLSGLAADQRRYNEYLSGVVNAVAVGKPTSRLEQLDNRIADCHTRRKAAIMRAAAATREA